MIYELALFAGIGAGTLATKYGHGWRTVCYVERNTFCVSLLQARIRDHILDDAPIWSDVRTFTKRNNQVRPFIRKLRQIRHNLVITAGFPCQPFSNAGQMLGAADPRNMWPDTLRIIAEIRPGAALLENVSALLRPTKNGPAYFGQILSNLAEIGYDARWGMLGASDVGASHKRQRAWILAHPNQLYGVCPKVHPGTQPKRDGKKYEARAWPMEFGHLANDGLVRAVPNHLVWGMVNGATGRMAEFTALGNAWVPPVAKVAWRLLSE